MAITDILVGDRVRWQSEGGDHRRGEVVEVTDEAIIVDFMNHNIGCRAKLYREDLEELKFKVIFRDIDIQIARGEKEI